MEFVKPTIAYLQIAPILIVLGVACAGVLVEAFLPRAARFAAQTVLAGGGVVVALVTTVLVWRDLPARDGGRGDVVLGGALVIDGPTVFLWALLLILALSGVALFADRTLDAGVSAFSGAASSLPGSQAERLASTTGREHTEVYPLLSFAVSGMLIFPAANDLLTMFVALEVLSLPLYLLAGLARRRRMLSQEAALKYFLLGAFSSGFFLYGIALVYGYAGTMEFAGISVAVQNSVTNHMLIGVGIGLLAIGLLFKVGAVPFHAWTPDVYQGAPTPLTAFMSAATKVAAFGALLRLFYVAFGSERWNWQPMLWLIAILSMVVGSVVAIAQTDVKRMLAYSSIAHTGFILTGVLGAQSAAALADGEVTSLQAVLFYLATYAFTVLGAFAVVSLVRDAAGEVSPLARWAGLGKASPVVGGVFAVFLLAMAGIPLTSGFIGKWTVFTVAASAGAWPVVIVAVLSSVAAAYFYLRVIRLVFFAEPPTDAPSVSRPSALTAGAIAVSLAVTVMLGVVPGPVLDLAAQAGEFIR